MHKRPKYYNRKPRYTSRTKPTYKKKDKKEMQKERESFAKEGIQFRTDLLHFSSTTLNSRKHHNTQANIRKMVISACGTLISLKNLSAPKAASCKRGSEMAADQSVSERIGSHVSCNDKFRQTPHCKSVLCFAK